jgi:hypothetical protein
MSEYYNTLRDKLKVTWLRLLKAESKRKLNKVAKLEKKIIKLELELKKEM